MHVEAREARAPRGPWAVSASLDGCCSCTHTAPSETTEWRLAEALEGEVRNVTCLHFLLVIVVSVTVCLDSFAERLPILNFLFTLQNLHRNYKYAHRAMGCRVQRI